MSAVGPPAADERIDDVIRSQPTAEGATLVGWVALAEWQKPGGETMVVLFGKPEASLVQLKTYLHSGLLNMVWKVYGEES